MLKKIMEIIMDDALIDKLADIAVEQQSKENVALPALRSNLKEINKSSQAETLRNYLSEMEFNDETN